MMRTYPASLLILMLGVAPLSREALAQQTSPVLGVKRQSQTTWTIPDPEHVRGLAFDGTNYYVGSYLEGIVRKYNQNGN